jgi:myo-inositol 2-dehydrogenase/D-chiro-inositol 1-dehydrogenase
MVTMTREGVFSDRPKWFFLERYNDAFIAEVKAFVEAIRNDTEPEVGGFDGLQPVLIAQAAKLSRELRRPVKISEIIDGM